MEEDSPEGNVPIRRNTLNAPRNIHLNKSPKSRAISNKETRKSKEKQKRISRNFPSLNSFNDMGHLSRRIFKDGGEDHTKHKDFQNSFGYRKVFDNDAAATAVTANTISKCLSSILHELIITGERLAAEGHQTHPRYDIFYGGGHNLRDPHPPLKSSISFNTPTPSMAMNYKRQMKAVHNHTSSSPDLFSARNRVSVAMPTVENITSFISLLSNASQMEYECMIIALIYIRRAIKKSNGQLLLLSDNWKGLFLACSILANKVWDDFHMLNRDYCTILSGVTVDRINSLEMAILSAVNCSCNVAPSIYAQTHFEIQAMITMTNIDKSRKSATSKASVDSSNKASKATVVMCSADHPSPYSNDDDENKSDDGSARLSVDDEDSPIIETPVFTPSLAKVEMPIARKKVLESLDFDDDDVNQRILARYSQANSNKIPLQPGQSGGSTKQRAAPQKKKHSFISQVFPCFSAKKNTHVHPD